MPRDYTRQGDTFTRKVQAGQGPRTVCALLNKWTGREYLRRVNVKECAALTVRDLKAVAPAALIAADLLEQYGGRVYWQPEARKAVLFGEGQALPDGTPEGGRILTFRLEPRGQARRDSSRGRAVFLECPHCARAVRTVYVSPWRADGWRGVGVCALPGAGVSLKSGTQNAERRRAAAPCGAVLPLATDPSGASGRAGLTAVPVTLTPREGRDLIPFLVGSFFPAFPFLKGGNGCGKGQKDAVTFPFFPGSGWSFFGVWELLESLPASWRG